MGIDDIYYSGTSYGSSTSSIGVGGGEVLNVSGIVNNVSIYQGMRISGGSYQLTYGSVNVLSGGTASVVYANGRLSVQNGGKVYSTFINNGGRLSVSSGGIASSVYVDDSGSYNSYGGYVPNVAGAYISSGGIVSNAFVKKQGHLHVSSSGRLVSATVSSGGTLCIHNGGILADTTVSDGGYIIIESNASLAGKLNLETNNCIISSGAVINFLLNENQSKETPYIFKYSNTGSNISSANFTITIGPDQSAGTYTLIEGVSAFSQSITVKNTAGSTLGTVSVGNNVSYGGYTYKLANNNAKLLFTISSTPVITDTIVPTLNGEPTVSVNGQNVAITWSAASDNVGVAGYQIKIGNNTYSTSSTSYSLSSLAAGTYSYQIRAYDAANNYSEWSSSKSFNISSSGNSGSSVESSAVCLYSGGTLYSSGTTMNNISINSGGIMYLSSGGTASNTTVNMGGSVCICGGEAINTTLKNTDGNNVDGPRMVVYNGGTAINTVAKDNGSIQLIVSSGGTAIQASGKMLVIVRDGGIASETVLSGIRTGGIVDGAQMQISSGGIAKDTTIGPYANIFVRSGGILFNTTISGGYGAIYNYGGLVQSATVEKVVILSIDPNSINRSAGLVLDSGGIAEHTVVRGLLLIKDGVHRGTLQIESGAVVSAYVGTTIDFTLTGKTATNNDYLVNDLSRIEGTPTYTITVSPTQSPGNYMLAGGASSFAGMLSLGTETENFGMISVNGDMLTHGNVTYRLTTENDSLFLTITGGSVNLPSVNSTSANITIATNQNVTVTANFSDNAAIKQYSLDNANWATYTDGVIMTDNGTVYFRAVNDAGYSDSVCYTVTNIDKVAPTKPTANANITAPTNQDVIVSATFSDDTATKQYSRDNSTWQTYTSGVVMSANGMVYFRGIDAAGNISDVTSYAVSNIDKVAPAKPTAAENTTAPTNQDVIVSATFSNDTATKQYSRDDSTWQTYTSSIVMSSNGMVYFRGIDEAGNVSDITSYVVSNIDKVAPTAPVAIASTTRMTNQNVTVAASYSEDSQQKQYSMNGTDWEDYTAGIVLSENGTVYFRGIDEAGNISEVTSYVVSNIDKVAPTPPVSIADITEPTEGPVLVSAGFSSDSVQKQYSLDGDVWSAYVESILFTENGTVYFRGIDEAGNISAVTEYVVSNIEKVVPEKTAGDLNMDGRADIIMTIDQSGHPADGSTGAWLIQADQTAAWGNLSTRVAGWEIFGTGKTVAGKNTDDVYIRNVDNVIGAWTTGDDGKVNGWETIGEFDSNTQIVGLGDFNANGQTDLLLRNTNGAVGCFFTGDEKHGWNYFQSLGDEWKLTAVGDLNGDGRDDVVLKHDAGFAGSWLTQEDGTMAWADLDTLPDGFEIVGAGDFDGDGTDDVLLKNGNYYGAWLVNNGNAAGWFGLGDLGNVTVEQIADFNGDGVDDLRIRTTAGDLGAQLVMGADTLDWKYYGSVGSEWSTALAALG